MNDVQEMLDQTTADILSAIESERSFRKVWGAVGILLFVYGLFYGVYLSK